MTNRSTPDDTGPQKRAHAEAWTLPAPRELSVSPGEVFSSPSKTLTEAHFLLFSAVTSDNHPIHYDVEYAKKNRFKRPLAHGLMMASLTALGASTVSTQLEGYVFVEQGCRFIRPAVLGDTISPRFKLDKIWEEGGKRYARFSTAIINQDDQIILEGYHIYRILGSNDVEEHFAASGSKP